MSHLLLPILPLALIPPYIYWYLARTKSMLTAWAASCGFTILEAKRNYIPPWRMWLTTSKSQVVMHVKVYDDATHRIRSGWLRLGSYWWGVFDADAVEVQWDDE